MKKKLILFA